LNRFGQQAKINAEVTIPASTLSAVDEGAEGKAMIRPRQLHLVLLFGGLLAPDRIIMGDDPKPPAAKSVAGRDVQKIPTKIAGTFSGGELVELRVRDRIAFLIKPTGKVDPQKRWLWDFPFWLAINDGFGQVAHRYYVEKALAAGFHIAGVD